MKSGENVKKEHRKKAVELELVDDRITTVPRE